MPLRAAAICGLLAPVTFILGLVLGDLAQSGEFSPANDNISDIGAQTADQAWLYNQIGANLNGLLIVAFALGLWRALGPGWLARLGVLGLAILGVTRFLEGFLRLDCGGMDDVCENTSWQSEAHGFESGIASALFFLVPPVLAFAFRRLPEWRDLWLPTLLAVPIVVAISIPFSLIGDGAAGRAGSVTWSLWLGVMAVAAAAPRGWQSRRTGWAAGQLGGKLLSVCQTELTAPGATAARVTGNDKPDIAPTQRA